MIGSGLKKLAKQYGLTVSNGVAYGSLNGYATTLSEGSGYKRIDISTRFTEPGQQQLQAAVNEIDANRKFRVQNMTFGSRWISIVFADTVGTMKKIEEFVAWFYPLLAQTGAAGANICPECGAEVSAGGWYLLSGVAYHFHESCADKVQSEFSAEDQQRKDEDTGSYGQGLLGAILGAILGAVVWAVVLMAGYVASIVGLLIGWLAEKGYTLLHGKQGKGKLAILIVAVIIGVLLGTFAGEALALAQMIGSGELEGFTYGQIPALLIAVLMESEEAAGAMASNVLMGLLFAGLGVFALLKKANAEVSGVKLKKLS